MATSATEYLFFWAARAQAEQRPPSITRVTCQAWLGVGPPPNFKPGIASYGWGINGRVITGRTTIPRGLEFETHAWFSDRGLDLSNPPPDCGQQFISNEADLEVITLTLPDTGPAGVTINVKSLTWGTDWTLTSELFDEPSQQLLFSGIPGAGPGAPPALMIVSFADTGAFGWL
jgi:hypothetical protein